MHWGLESTRVVVLEEKPATTQPVCFRGKCPAIVMKELLSIPQWLLCILDTQCAWDLFSKLF